MRFNLSSFLEDVGKILVALALVEALDLGGGPAEVGLWLWLLALFVRYYLPIVLPALREEFGRARAWLAARRSEEGSA